MGRSSSVRIVTDTVASLLPEYVAEHPIPVVSQIVNFGEESFLENVQISYPEFIRRLKSSPQLPKTAAPPPGEFIQVYEALLREADTILSIHPSTDVSGTVRSALTAKETCFPDADIRVLDTRHVGSNLAAMVMDAVAWAGQGVSADEIMARLQAMIPRGRTYFVLSTLEYLQKGGRIGGAAALIGSALQIKPILEIRQGRVEPMEKIRTHAHALERLQELVVQACPRTPQAHVAVMHADDRVRAEALAATLKAALGAEQIPIYTVSASITTHAGPGALAVGFFV